MFYSHTFLGRKSSLGTVWIAAHLQHKLRKPQIERINISISVDSIMFPEIPIALRLSGHLLLGVVRIFSKKVDYLYHDCNEALTQLRSAFLSRQVNLPEDANTAPVHSITLPETLELDALNLDDILNRAIEAPDNHLKTLEQITLSDPDERYPYTSYHFGEDFGLSQFDHPNDNGLHDSGTVPLTGVQESNGELYENHLAQETPDIARAEQDLRPDQLDGILPELNDNGIVEEPEPVEQARNVTPLLDQGNKVSISREGLQFPQVDEEPFPMASGEAHRNSDLVPSPLELGLEPTPPNQQQIAKKSRKRKQFYDVTIVLTNEFMKKQLQDTRNILRKRKRVPCSIQDAWEASKRSRKEQFFLGPSVHGICVDLQEIFKIGSPASNVQPTPRRTRSEYEQSPAAMPVGPPEIEESPFDTGRIADTVPEMGQSREVTTPLSTLNLEHSFQFESTADTVNLYGTEDTVNLYGTEGRERTFETLPGTEEPDSIEHALSVETEIMHRAEGLDTIFETEFFSGTERLEVIVETVGFPETGEPSIAGSERLILEETPDIRLNPVPLEDLSFLEADSSHTGLGRNGVDDLPVRTRAVAKYLVRKACKSQNATNQPGELSLNSILRDRTRKECARMFFETLVLKSHGLIDVCQTAPYSDIKISVAPAIEKSQLHDIQNSSGT